MGITLILCVKQMRDDVRIRGVTLAHWPKPPIAEFQAPCGRPNFEMFVQKFYLPVSLSHHTLDILMKYLKT